MIDSLQPLRAGGGALPGRPLVVELAGPAAAGKTSLLQALARSDTRLRLGYRLPKYHHLATALQLAPTLVALHRPYRALLWNEMKRMTYLGTLQRRLEGPRAEWGRGVVLDEGAVYMLARLRVFGGERIRSKVFEQWWDAAIRRWAGILDIIVWLDAPDPVLLHRLRTRSQAHPVRGLDAEAIGAFIASYRTAYDHVIGALTAGRGPVVLPVRSDREPLAHTVERLVTEMTKRAACDR